MGPGDGGAAGRAVPVAGVELRVGGDPGTAQPPGPATDAAGNVQPDVPPGNRLGYGNNAIELSYVDVR